jgi:Nucleotidyl transferase AbiEii toxin, Type IV TA system
LLVVRVPLVREFLPRVDTLPPAQVRLWPELSSVPKDFVLYGGTALALHLGHRQSEDFDFFARRELNIQALETGIPFLSGANVIQRAPDTLSVMVERGGPVKVSFFGLPRLGRLERPLIAKDNRLQVASLLELAGTKASVVQARAEARDYIDMDALMRVGHIGLPDALSAAKALYGPSFNPEITLKALTYFGDGNLRDLPDDLKLRLLTAVRGVDLDHLPAIRQEPGLNSPSDHGIEV